MVFKDRLDAGRQLAEELQNYSSEDGIVLAIPRGGVVVGAEIAKRLGLKMDLIIPRKIGSPQNPEVAIGAITQDGTSIYDRRLIKILGVSEFDLKEKASYEIEEIQRRMSLYRGDDKLEDYQGRQLIVVDDGVATGYTMLAALRSARNYRPRELILGIPVAPPDTLELLNREVDRAVCLISPDDFYAVGQFYEYFDQTEDEDVIRIMKDLKTVTEEE